MKKISWFTPQNTDISGLSWYSAGYQNAGLNLINALKQKEIAVYWNKRDISIHINFCQPYYYQFNNTYNIGYTPWESTKVPPGWLNNMELSDEIWTTSSFVKEVYEANGVDKDIFVLHHGISDDWSISDREITKTFNFLHVGGDSQRKNSQMVVDAFLDLYSDNKDYKLILKYNERSGATVSNLPAEEHPQILGIPGNTDIYELVNIFHKCHCLVYPTMGEGFGMIPFEAIATGMPTICTDLTGCKDFAHMSMPLKASWSDAYQNNNMYCTDTGLWASPDYNDLISNMINVTKDYDKYKKQALQSAKIIHEDWSWSAIADKLISRLKITNYF